jgi:hypothetical protein
LEGFVKDYLGFVPTQPKGYTRHFSPNDMSVIKNMWRKVKCEANGKPILLAGRDVFVFEVLARREHFPTTFRPDISRHTVSKVKEDYSGYFLFDTGFAGSIPKGLSIGNYTMASSLKNRVSNRGLLKTETNQAFPRMKGARSLALKIEYTPKYWKAGYWRDETGISQVFTDPDEFLRAAHLTIEIFTDSSPRLSTLG